MKKPELIMHNFVSLDGAFTGFELDPALHYNVAAGYHAEMFLVGSETFLTGLKMYNGFAPEDETDFTPPENPTGLGQWVVVDSAGISRDWLHIARRSEHCSDVILLVSETTSRDFIDYLEKRRYDYHICGKDKVDLAQGLDWLVETYGVKTIMVDSGPVLNGVLLEQGLLDEISLLVHPVLTGGNATRFLQQLTNAADGVRLELIESRDVGAGVILLHYRVIRER